MTYRIHKALVAGLGLTLLLAAAGAAAGQDEEAPEKKKAKPKPRPAIAVLGGFFNPRDPASLLRNEKVQEELKLDGDQKGTVQEINQALNKRRRDLFAELRAAKPEERKKKQAEYRTKLREARDDANKKAVAALKDEQQTRLDQIQLQLRGIAALSEKAVVKKLELTDEQQQKVAAAHDEFAKESTKLRNDVRAKKIDFAKYREKQTELTKARDEKITGTLTKDQAAQFEKMKGEKFELPRPKLRAVPLKVKLVPGKLRKAKAKPEPADPQQDDE